MPPPTCRSELEHNVYLLVDDIERHIDDAAYLDARGTGQWHQLIKQL